MIQIETLTSRPELAPVLAFWAYGEWYAGRSIDFTTVLRAYQARGKEGSTTLTLIALVDSYPAGMVSLRPRELKSCPSMGPWLSSLYVVPGYRRRGIAQTLMDNLCARARENGYPSMYLFLNPGTRDNLRPYYSRRGWTFHTHAQDNDGAETEIFTKQTV